MIRKVKFSNFYSFKNEQEIDFTAKKKSGYDYFKSPTGTQLTKIAGFFGSNASGKTNIIRFFSFLSHFACTNNRDSSSPTHIAYKTFFNNDKPSNFYIEFELENSIYYYEFSLHNNVITREALSIRKIEKYSKLNLIYLRNLNHVKELNMNYFKDVPRNYLKSIRSDLSLLGFLKSHYDIPIINLVYRYFANFNSNISEKGHINHNRKQVRILEMYLKDPELKRKVEEFICKFDIGLSNVEIKKETKDHESFITVNGVHKTNEIKNQLPFEYESRGTKSLFFLLAHILNGLKKSGVIVIDEMELGFHPQAFDKLLGFFIDENINSNAQLIFSSNYPEVMNKLDMHQIYLVEKNNFGESVSFRLNRVKKIRTDENFFGKYITGTYGAFPKIRI